MRRDIENMAWLDGPHRRSFDWTLLIPIGFVVMTATLVIMLLLAAPSSEEIKCAASMRTVEAFEQCAANEHCKYRLQDVQSYRFHRERLERYSCEEGSVMK